MQTVRRKTESKENIIATVTRKEDKACEIVSVKRRGKEITTFNVVNNIPNYFIESMVRATTKNLDNTVNVIIRRPQVAMNA